MKHYVGLDVSLNEVSICVVDADGAVIAEAKVATEPGPILSSTFACFSLLTRGG